MTAPYTDHDEIVNEAFELCERVRECAPVDNYRHLAIRCAQQPERMAQIMIALAAMVDTSESLLRMTRRVNAISADKTRVAARRLA